MKKLFTILALVSIANTAIAQAPLLTGATKVNVKERINDKLPWIGEYNAPPEYAKWFEEVRQCLNLDPYIAPTPIKYFYVNADEFLPNGEGEYGLATTFAAQGQIFVGISQVMREDVIKHEAVHFFLYVNGISDVDHPTTYFETCGIHTTLPLHQRVADTKISLGGASR